VVLNTLEKLFQKKASANPGWSLSHALPVPNEFAKGCFSTRIRWHFVKGVFTRLPAGVVIFHAVRCIGG